MNEKIQYILNKVQQSNKFSEEEKDSILKSLKDADKEISISAFKIERLEKVKYTTTVLLEQTIEELESKRKSVEQQKRALEIEAALERVRAIAMGMRKPDDMLDICRTIAEELRKLDVNEIRNVQTAIFYNEKGTYTNYEFYVKHDKTFITETEFRNHPVAEEFARQMTKGPNDFFSHGFTGKKVQEWLAYQKTTNVFIDSYLQTATSLDYYWYSLGPVALGLSTYKPLAEEEQELFRRFRNVFELAYRRYLDIEKAELQAKESQIQLALERVRARTMAMQHSDELSETAYILFQQFRQLGEDPIQITIGIFNEEQNVIEFRITGGDGSGSKIDQTFHAEIDEPMLINKFFRAWKENKKSTVISLEGKELSQWVAYRNKISGKYAHETEVKNTDRRYAAAGFFSKGLLSISKTQNPSEQTIQILERFASVFDLTYTRFLDLKNAEAQAREARIEAALERVRSRTLAMQKSEELSETSVVLFKQLITLGIEPNRLYICIIKDSEGNAEFWITDEDGSKVSCGFEANLNENGSFKKMFEGWKLQKISLTIDMQGTELEEYFKHLNSLNVPFKGGLSQQRRVQNISYFSKGFIGIASPNEQPEETIQLLDRFASVFNLTFTRFNDLQLAEAHALQAEQDLMEIKAARQKAEDTLRELKATQAQLIVSEKMASLGELTAGIAHEIQNPLNFVNNFAEINTELVDELNSELEKGNMEEAMFLATDLKDNNQKIVFHGKRAESIVKGMLQHSRASTGKKELADINALADEFLRLSYHGLRAKDKAFNAILETHFDSSIAKINVSPQDVGRVFLNLFNNAFYAVNEKKKLLISAYEPIVQVTTAKSQNYVEIRVRDNGTGIPEKVLDKIYQPFFTTKPTGEGTGLGLSLSYDIITKGHGGQMKVKTKEGEGSEFVIQLPFDNPTA